MKSKIEKQTKHPDEKNKDTWHNGNVKIIGQYIGIVNSFTFFFILKWGMCSGADTSSVIRLTDYGERQKEDETIGALAVCTNNKLCNVFGFHLSFFGVFIVWLNRYANRQTGSGTMCILFQWKKRIRSRKKPNAMTHQHHRAS